MNGKNIRRRKKINEALPTMPTPFSSHDMSEATGIPPRRVQGLLRGMPGVEKFKVKRNAGVKVNYILVDTAQSNGHPRDAGWGEEENADETSHGLKASGRLSPSKSLNS